MSDRDTRYQKFARSVMQDLLASRERNYIDITPDDREEIEAYSTIIAQRVYDLMQEEVAEHEWNTITSKPQVQAGIRRIAREARAQDRWEEGGFDGLPEHE